MNPHYNQNYSREEIKDILAKTKKCVTVGKKMVAILFHKRNKPIDYLFRKENLL